MQTEGEPGVAALEKAWMIMSSRSRSPRASTGGALQTHHADADLTTVRVSNICPHQWAALRVEVESLVKSARIKQPEKIREGKPIMKWDSKLRRMVATPLHDSCYVVMDTRERAERLVHALDGLARLGTHLRAALVRPTHTCSKPPEPSMDALYEEARMEKELRERALSMFPSLPSAVPPLAVDPRVASGANLPAAPHAIPCESVSEDASSVVSWAVGSVASSAARTTLAVACRFCKTEGHFARRVDGTPSCPVLVRKLECEAAREAEERAFARKELALARQELALEVAESWSLLDLEHAIALKERAYEAESKAEQAANGQAAANTAKPQAADVAPVDAAMEEPNRQQKRMAKRKAKSRAKRAAASATAQ